MRTLSREQVLGFGRVVVGCVLVGFFLVFCGFFDVKKTFLYPSHSFRHMYA